MCLPSNSWCMMKLFYHSINRSSISIVILSNSNQRNKLLYNSLASPFLFFSPSLFLPHIKFFLSFLRYNLFFFFVRMIVASSNTNLLASFYYSKLNMYNIWFEIVVSAKWASWFLSTNRLFGIWGFPISYSLFPIFLSWIFAPVWSKILKLEFKI